MEDNQSKTSQLKNPTKYHLLATHRQLQSLNDLHDLTWLVKDQHFDFADCYENPSYSPHIKQQEDDVEFPNLKRRISDLPFLQSSSNMFEFISSKGSPSDHSSSVDMFPIPQPSPYFVDHRHNDISSLQKNTQSIYERLSSPFNQSLSAPTYMGYDILGGIASQPSSISTTFSQSTSSQSLEECESIQINHQLLSEKKRRKRKLHNAVERRRRENINERIQELSTILPAAMLEELITVSANGSSNKPNKGAILRKSVDHIRILQQEVSSHKQRIHVLEKQLAGLST